MTRDKRFETISLDMSFEPLKSRNESLKFYTESPASGGWF